MKALRASVSLVRIAIYVQCIVHVLFKVSLFGELGMPMSERMQIIAGYSVQDLPSTIQLLVPRVRSTVDVQVPFIVSMKSR